MGHLITSGAWERKAASAIDLAMANLFEFCTLGEKAHFHAFIFFPCEL
jgi:hypothetical protein